MKTMPTISLPSRSAARTRGFTMIEMLVALVVLSIGMLGVAGLFVVSLRSGSSAVSRMQAVNLASDIADRIRANRRAGDGYTAAGADNKCTGAGAVVCTPALLAADDVFRWQNQIKGAFPGGTATGAIAFAAAASSTQPSTYKITVSWSEQGQAIGEAASAQSYIVYVQAPTN
jgi:type IV pilus assembly protein PilV